jgi:hypothetical protein
MSRGTQFISADGPHASTFVLHIKASVAKEERRMISQRTKDALESGHRRNFCSATRPFLPKHDRATLIVSHDVERVLANIDADHGNCAVALLGHGVLLVFGAPRQLQSLAGQEHGRTIPLADLR